MFTENFVKAIQENRIEGWSLYFLTREILTRRALHPDEVRKHFSCHLHRRGCMFQGDNQFVKSLKTSRDIPVEHKIRDFRFLFEIETDSGPKLILQSDSELEYFQHNNTTFSNRFLTKLFRDKVSRLEKVM